MARLYGLVMLPLVKDDLEEIQVYVARDDPTAAVAFTDRILARIQSLARLPFRNPVAPESKDPGMQVRVASFPPYRILYAVRGSVVTVLRVRHGARRPLRRIDEA